MPQTRSFLEHRSAGVLLHPTSLPNAVGAGDLGPVARAFINQLAVARLTWWQMLPLNPPGEGDSPYESRSAFAGNPLLISLDDLLAEGLLTPTDLKSTPSPKSREFPLITDYKHSLLQKAFYRLRVHHHKTRTIRNSLEHFCDAHAFWLDDYALFATLREFFRRHQWQTWPSELAYRHPRALQKARTAFADQIAFQKFVQFLFFRQLSALHAYARQRHIEFLFDLPFFVSGQSADVWAHPNYFKLAADGQPKFVAGVPPDDFSKRGQRWGNPSYNWPALRRTGFAWWIARCRAALAYSSVLRIDHFRGFSACWEIPAKSPDARSGKWRPGPGRALLSRLQAALDDLPFIVEDLGLITPEVEALRDRFALSSMRVLQFAFNGDPANPHLPHRYPQNSLAVTATHDNDTTRGWFAHLPAKSRTQLFQFAPGARTDPVGALVRLAWSSVSRLAIIPLQDLLELDSRARMNRPGTLHGNWKWRWTPRPTDQSHWRMLSTLTRTYDRAAARRSQ